MAIIDKLSAFMQKHNYTKADVAKLSGIPYTTIDGLFKKGDENTKLSTLKKLSAFMGCTLDELTAENEPKKVVALNSRDKRDIQKRLQEILNDMNTDGMAMFNGEDEMDEETKDLLRTSIQHSIEVAKIRAKEKFTPKKYKK